MAGLLARLAHHAVPLVEEEALVLAHKVLLAHARALPRLALLFICLVVRVRGGWMIGRSINQSSDRTEPCIIARRRSSLVGYRSYTRTTRWTDISERRDLELHASFLGRLLSDPLACVWVYALVLEQLGGSESDQDLDVCVQDQQSSDLSLLGPGRWCLSVAIATDTHIDSIQSWAARPIAWTTDSIDRPVERRRRACICCGRGGKRKKEW